MGQWSVLLVIYQEEMIEGSCCSSNGESVQCQRFAICNQFFCFYEYSRHMCFDFRMSNILTESVYKSCIYSVSVSDWIEPIPFPWKWCSFVDSWALA